jgi:hypothetical protein
MNAVSAAAGSPRHLGRVDHARAPARRAVEDRRPVEHHRPRGGARVRVRAQRVEGLARRDADLS